MLRKRADWPNSEIDAFVDDEGWVVVSYAKEGLDLKQLNAYMNRFAKRSPKVYEFKLKKDATRWGVTNEDMENIFFVFCPPWIHSKPDLSKSLNGSRAVVDTSNELALDSGRVPFGPQSASGNCIQIHVTGIRRRGCHVLRKQLCQRHLCSLCMRCGCRRCRCCRHRRVSRCRILWRIWYCSCRLIIYGIVYKL